VYVSTAGAFQNLQNKISAGIQTDINRRNKKCPPGAVFYTDSEGKNHACN
jgi:hypothetical protein